MFALLGVFKNIEWQWVINSHFENKDSLFWLPWGNRTKTLQVAMSHLCKNKCWKKEKYTSFNHYLSNSKKNELKFFHHYSKKQDGTMKVHFYYCIKHIIIAQSEVEPLKVVTHDLLEPKSKVWFGLTNYNSAFRLGKPLDFASDFDLIQNLHTFEKHQFDAFKDSHKLYYDMALVRHFTHRNKVDCRCPTCK
jgi:hypothetical protein